MTGTNWFKVSRKMYTLICHNGIVFTYQTLI